MDLLDRLKRVVLRTGRQPGDAQRVSLAPVVHVAAPTDLAPNLRPDVAPDELAPSLTVAAASALTPVPPAPFAPAPGQVLRRRGDALMQQLNARLTGARTGAAAMSRANRLLEGLSYQTNFLALDAAAQAARVHVHGAAAGDGMAALANELRGLSDRNVGAAREMKALLAAIDLDLESSVELARQAAAATDELVADAGQGGSSVSVTLPIATLPDGLCQRGAAEHEAGHDAEHDALQTDLAAVAGLSGLAVVQSLHVQSERLSEAVQTFRTGRARIPQDCVVPADESMAALKVAPAGLGGVASDAGGMRPTDVTDLKTL